MVNFTRPSTQVVPFEDLPSTDTPVGAAWLNAVDTALTAPVTAQLRLLLATRTAGARPVVFCGSSTTAGENATAAANRWVNLLTRMMQAAYPVSGTPSTILSLADAVAALPLPLGVHGVNAGVSGATSATYLTSTTRAQIDSLDPAVLIHMIGANDYETGVNPATYATNLDTQLDALDTAISGPHVHVLVQSYRRRDVASPAFPWADYGNAMATVAATDPTRRVYVDISAPYEAVDIGGADPLNLLDTDLAHQTDAGHAVMAELLRATLDIPGAASAPASTSVTGTLSATLPMPTAALVSSTPVGTDPADVAGLVALFRASDLALADTDPVATWAPTAGAETAALAQATSGQRPVFRTNQVGGQPAVRFTAASSHALDTGNWGTNRPVPVTVFLVAQANVGNSGNFYSGRSGVFCYCGQEAAGDTLVYVGAGITNEASWSITEGTSAWHVFAVVYNGASSARYYDTTTPTTINTGTGASAALPGLRLSSNSGGTAFFLDGAIAEIAVVNGAMTNTAIGDVLEFLADRYSITIT